MRQLSKQQSDRLRIMYAFDLATKWGELRSEVVFSEGLNPVWIKDKDVLNDGLILERLDKFKSLKIGEIGGMGCFKVRRTNAGVVVYTNIARINL
jgi:hypothetical protein